MSDMHPINQALNRPILIAGVERRLVLANFLVGFALLACCHGQVLALFFIASMLGISHGVLSIISRHDPNVGLIFKRATRYMMQPAFMALSHPSARSMVVHSLPRNL